MAAAPKCPGAQMFRRTMRPLGRQAYIHRRYGRSGFYPPNLQCARSAPLLGSNVSTFGLFPSLPTLPSAPFSSFSPYSLFLCFIPLFLRYPSSSSHCGVENRGKFWSTFSKTPFPLIFTGRKLRPPGIGIELKSLGRQVDSTWGLGVRWTIHRLSTRASQYAQNETGDDSTTSRHEYQVLLTWFVIVTIRIITQTISNAPLTRATITRAPVVGL